MVNNYLEQIALRSGGMATNDTDRPSTMQPVTYPFGEIPVPKSGEEEWGGIIQPAKHEDDPLPGNEPQKVGKPASPQKQKPAKNPAAPAETYPGTHVNRTLVTSRELTEKTELKKSFVEERIIQASEPLRFTVSEQAGHRDPVNEQPQIKNIPSTNLQTNKADEGLEKVLSPRTAWDAGKVNRQHNVLQPNKTFVLPASNAKTGPEKKLVIGKITVEIVKPAVHTKERIVIREQGTSERKERPEINKLSFGLGQL